MSLVPVPEIRAMVEAGQRFVAGEIHFSAMIGPAETCVWWARVHGVHPAIQTLAAHWLELADQVWNEHGQHPRRLPVEEFRRRVAEDLGIDPDPSDEAG